MSRKRIQAWVSRAVLTMVVASILWVVPALAESDERAVGLEEQGRQIALSAQKRWVGKSQVLSFLEGLQLAAEADPGEPEVPVALSDAESTMVALVNAERVEAGAAPLRVDSRLVQTARAKSADMVVNSYFGHISPTLGSPFHQLQEAGIAYRIAAENLAGGSTVESVHRSLIGSQVHRENLLNPNLTHIGIGVVEGGLYGLMVTQHFIAE